MAKSNSEQTIWGTRLQVQSPKQGPLADYRQELLSVLRRAKKFGILMKTGRNTYEWEHENYYASWSTSKVAVAIQVNFTNDQVQVATIDCSSSDKPKSFYNLTQDGSAVDLDEMSIEEQNLSRVASCVRWATGILQGLINREVADRRDRWRRFFKRTIISAGSAAIVTLLVFCARWWWFEPYEASNRARVMYNAENHQLDGAGYPVGSHTLTKLPASVLQSMPEFGGDDKSLNHPRTISLRYGSSSKSWCKDTKVEIPENAELVVGIAEDSPFIRDHYVASYVDQTLTVCLVDGFSRQDASENIVVRLALQAKAQKSTE